MLEVRSKVKRFRLSSASLDIGLGNIECLDRGVAGCDAPRELKAWFLRRSLAAVSC